MINATISENGNLIISAYGDDTDKLKSLKGKFSVSEVGTNINTKTGRKHYIISMEPVVEESTQEPKSIKEPPTKRKSSSRSKEPILESLPEDEVKINEEPVED